MTRKEQIIQAAKQAEKKDGFTQIVKDAKGVNSAYGIGFLEGAEWADGHPNLTWKDIRKIRKGIIRNLEYLMNRAEGFVKDELKERIDWLEKQGKQDARYKYLEELLEADTIYQMAMNDAMVEEAKNKAINALQELSVSKLLGLKKLEKLGKQKPQEKSTFEAIKEEKVDNQNCVKPANKVESKFHKGQWIIDKERKEVFYISKNLANTYKIVDIEGNDYYVPHYILEEDYDVWTIQDAKDGDVLYSPAHNILWIYKDKERYHAAINLNYAIFVSFNADIVIIPSDVQPATKEQSARLFKKMKKAGYEWSDKDRKLIKIVK